MFEDSSPQQVGAIAKEEPKLARAIGRQEGVISELTSVLDTLEKRLQPISLQSPVNQSSAGDTPEPMRSAVVGAIERNSDRLDATVSRIRMILSGLEV